MNNKTYNFAILIAIASAHAQNEKTKHFEISISGIFWTPTAAHLKAINSVTQYAYPDGSYLTLETFSGYGNSLAPKINFKYYFNENIGLSLGLNMVNLDNKLRIQKTDTIFDSYENLALIPNITVGISGKIFHSQSLHFFYETGINFVPDYYLEMQYADHSSDPPDLNAEGMALGVYGTSGVNLKLTHLLYFQTALSYSFIPVDLEYTNGEKSVKINEKTNLGGLGLQMGLSFNF